MRWGTLCVAAFAGSGVAQDHWFAPTAAVPRWRNHTALAYDSVRDRVVLVGDRPNDRSPYLTDTWEWDGARWHERRTNYPLLREGHALAFDPVRGRVVLFGGFYAPGVPQPMQWANDTWEYDGSSWRFVTATAPRGRRGHAMTFDVAAQRVLLFGGSDNTPNTPSFGDMWAWNGATWSALSVALPPSRTDCAHAFDSVRNRWVVVGGVDANGTVLGDVWEWGSGAWTQRAAGPSARTTAAMAFDGARGVAVLHGGRDGSGALLSDLWEWNGTSWSQRPNSGSPRAQHAAVYRGGAVMLYGGIEGAAVNSASVTQAVDTWDGSTFLRGDAGEEPHGLRPVALGTQILRVGELGAWTWRDAGWHRVGVPMPGLAATLAVEDVGRGRIVCIAPQTAMLAEFDGAAWHVPPRANAIPPRSACGAAYDWGRGTMVLFGGYDSAGVLAETWEWDGSQWLQRNPSISPPPRSFPVMSWDPQVGGILLFGGADRTWLQETWSFDGFQWMQHQTSGQPLPGFPARMVLHEVEGRAYLFTDWGTWRWLGNDWQQVAIPGYAFAFDRSRAQFVGIDGSVESYEVYPPMFFGPHAAPAVASSGAGCGSPAPRLFVETPFLGNSSLTFDVMDASPSSLTVFALGDRAANVAIGNGCTLWLGGAVATMLSVTDAHGFQSLHRSVPAANGLLGAQFFAQAFVLDAAAGTLAATGAYALTIGN